MTIRQALIGSFSVALLGACASVNIPDADILKMDTSHEGAKDLKAYPKITQAPKAPTDLRSDKAWDKAARNIMKKRDGFVVPDSLAPAKSAEELQRDVERARAKVHEYKKDDPQ